MKAIEERKDQLIRDQFNDLDKAVIISNLIAEAAVNLGDAEIERCLKCVAPWLARRAKMYRDCGFLLENEIKVK